MLVPKTALGVSRCTDPDYCRYALGAVCLERGPEGPLAVATDGRMLIAVTWPEPDEVPAAFAANGAADARLSSGRRLLIHAKQATEVARTCETKQRLISKTPALGCALVDESTPEGAPIAVTTVRDGSRSTRSVEQVEGRYPQWRDCFPRAEAMSTFSVELNPALLTKLLSVAAEHCPDRGVVLTFDVCGQKPYRNPVLVTVHDAATGHLFAGVISPIGADHPPVPGWVPEPHGRA